MQESLTYIKLSLIQPNLSLVLFLCKLHGTESLYFETSIGPLISGREVAIDHLKRWLDLLIDAFFTKSYKKTKSVAKKTPKYILPIFFHNKGLEFLNLHNQDVISAKKTSD